MKLKKIIRGSVFVLALALSAVSLYKLSDVKKSSASVVKNSGQAVSQSSLTPVVYNGENMYVAKASYYDYYSDSQIGTSATPGGISDACVGSKNTFGKFNTRLMEVMKYNVPAECPAKYPLYQGRQGSEFSDLSNIFSFSNDSINENSNYWLGANTNQVGSYALQGLVDNKLIYDSKGESYVTQSNPANGKRAILPYFDKKVLTSNKHTNSELALGGVKENVSFPFRKETENGVIYYEFDSAVDTVRFNANDKLEYYGKNNSSEMVKDQLGGCGLFPENVAADSTSNKLNFGYGFKIEVPFNMTSDGKIDGKDMVFTFTGDDDVWVFIDGILALDLGGAHPRISGSINFATGKTVVSGVKNSKVALATRTMNGFGTGTVNKPELGLVNVPAVYKNHTQTLSNELMAKLRDTTEVHTLTLFYMERGMVESNMKMKFNLPEPTKLDVANTIETDVVGEAFEAETRKVTDKETFLYDVVDKSKNTKAAIDMLGGESVTFSNEFSPKDILLVQQVGVKSQSRTMTDLYATSWVLKDYQNDIAKGDDLVVKDPRRDDKTVLFKNKDDDTVPVLRTEYTNKPLVGKFVIKCSVSDKYKDNNSDYKNTEFKYVLTYSDVFGGGSSSKTYSGKYTVVGQSGEGVEKTTTDGVITLKADEKAVIADIPVLTVVKVKAQVGDNAIVGKIKLTNQFKYDKNTYTAEGKVNDIANVVEYVIADKTEKVEKEDDLSKNEVEDILGEKVPTYKQPEKIEQASVDEDALDDTAQTGDETDLKTWAIIMAVSLLLTVGSGISMVSSKDKKEY